MKVYLKGNKGAVNYRGIAFVNEDAVEVSPEWLSSCKSPRITQKRAAKRKAPKVKPDSVTLDAMIEAVDQ